MAPVECICCICYSRGLCNRHGVYYGTLNYVFDMYPIQCAFRQEVIICFAKIFFVQGSQLALWTSNYHDGLFLVDVRTKAVTGGRLA